MNIKELLLEWFPSLDSTQPRMREFTSSDAKRLTMEAKDELRKFNNKVDQILRAVEVRATLDESTYLLTDINEALYDVDKIVKYLESLEYTVECNPLKSNGITQCHLLIKW